jgi:ATP-dependent Clp protease ATP-binding subunit ClpB
LKRAIQKELETPLARKIVAGEIKDGQTVKVDVAKDAMKFEVESLAGAAAS